MARSQPVTLRLNDESALRSATLETSPSQGKMCLMVTKLQKAYQKRLEPLLTAELLIESSYLQSNQSLQLPNKHCSFAIYANTITYIQLTLILTLDTGVS